MSLRITSTLAALIAAFLLSNAATARNFTLFHEVSGSQFLEKFWFWNYNDPTGGTVNYVNQLTAVAKKLAYVDSSNRFVMRADNTSIVPAGSGRPSVRIHSYFKVGDGVLVGKSTHMPQGCGTWPAFWTCTTDTWPAGGEVDVVEGANDQGPKNLASLHTTHGCHVPAGYRSDQTGFTGQTDCSYQPGCSSSFTADNSFGPQFNQNGGGYFAVRRKTQPGDPGIGIYFWPITANRSSLPSVVAAFADGNSAPKCVVTNSNATGNDRTELNKWGTPNAFFVNTANASASATALQTGNGSVCQMGHYFDGHEIIINLTFCGDWAGPTFGTSGCSAQYNNATCSDFVHNNPAAFTDARWEVEYLRVYSNASNKLQPAWTLLLAPSLLLISYLAL